MGGDQGQLTSPTPPVPSEARQRGQHRWAITGSVLAHSQPALGAAGGVFTEGGGGTGQVSLLTQEPTLSGFTLINA